MATTPLEQQLWDLRERSSTSTAIYDACARTGGGKQPYVQQRDSRHRHSGTTTNWLSAAFALAALGMDAARVNDRSASGHANTGRRDTNTFTETQTHKHVHRDAGTQTRSQRRRHTNTFTETKAHNRVHRDAGTHTRSQRRRHSNTFTETQTHVSVRIQHTRENNMHAMHTRTHRVH
jgi:hypothetical protein